MKRAMWAYNRVGHDAGRPSKSNDVPIEKILFCRGFSQRTLEDSTRGETHRFEAGS